jgi:hypothetical protein
MPPWLRGWNSHELVLDTSDLVSRDKLNVMNVYLGGDMLSDCPPGAAIVEKWRRSFPAE